MAGRTRTRADLAAAAQRASGASRAVSGDLVDQIIELITETLERGESVQFSSFGTFELRQRSERIGRNPKTGEEVRIPPHMAVTFRGSEVMKKVINEVSS